MEEKENSSSGGVAVTVSGDEAPESYRVEPRTESYPVQFGTGTEFPAEQTPSSAAAATVPEAAKKKRGRPRKYRPDGTVSLALSPMPISASIPLAGEYSGWKRGRAKTSSADSSAAKKSQNLNHNNKFEVFETQGQGQGQGQGRGMGIAYSVGANFTPHVLTVNAGEDVTMKVMTFSQQGARAVCILSANGTISNVTLRQPTTSGGTLTYEGRFEILSLSGSYMPTEIGGTKSRSGGMSVSLAGPDGRIVGGGLAGLLIAAGPVQVVVGSFLPGHQQEQKSKKQKITESTISPPPPPPGPPPPIINSVSGEDSRGIYSVIKPIVTPYNLDNNNSSDPSPVQGYRSSVPENVNNNNNNIIVKPISLPEEQPKGLSHPNCEVSC